MGRALMLAGGGVALVYAALLSWPVSGWILGGIVLMGLGAFWPTSTIDESKYMPGIPRVHRSPRIEPWQHIKSKLTTYANAMNAAAAARQARERGKPAEARATEG